MPNPHPTLVSLSPVSALAGSSSFTLTVNGTNFISSSIVSFDGTNLATTFINSTQLTALVPASLISSGKSKHVEVVTPTPGGGESRDLVFVLYTNLIKVVTNTSGMQLVLNVPGDNVNNLVTIAANAISFDLGSVLSNDDLVAVQPTLVGLAKNGAIQVVSTAPEITYNQAATPVVASSPFVKSPVRLAAITPLPANTYNNGASGVGATLTANSGMQLTVDQTLANVGDRILVAGEATASHNGIYTVSNIGQNATGTSISLPTGTDHGAVSNTSFADGLFNLSTSFWIKTTDAGNFRRILDKANDAVGGGGWEIYLLTGGFLWVTFRDPSSNSYQVFTTSASINDGSWHNVVVTYDGTNGTTVYVDGALVPITVNNGSPLGSNYSGSTPFGIGDIDGSSNQSFAGKLTALQLWNATLTASNASTLASGGSVPTGLIASWAFTEGSGNTAADSVGGNTLFFTNVSWNSDAPIQVSTGGTPYVLNRSTDLDMWNQVAGTLVACTGGVAEADSDFLCTSPSTGTMGTTAINFSPLTTLVPPRLTATQISAVQNPVEGMVVWNLTTHTINAYDGTSWKAVTLS